MTDIIKFWSVKISISWIPLFFSVIRSKSWLGPDKCAPRGGKVPIRPYNPGATPVSCLLTALSQI